MEGGATRISGGRNRYFDVEPKKGRVLIFQQRGIWHSGEDVVKGLKYTLRTDFLFNHSLEEDDWFNYLLHRQSQLAIAQITHTSQGPKFRNSKCLHRSRLCLASAQNHEGYAER